jgi:hypothetical protein
MLKCHWVEENQHTKTDVLEIARMAALLSPEELEAAYDQMQSLAGLVDETFVGQVEEELNTFQAVVTRTLSAGELDTLRDRLLL